MKKVFSSNAQLAHIWANQSQSEGRGNNMFFRDSMIFSYGTHYLAAQIHTTKSKKFALVNSYNYSSSTAKHLSLIRNALNSLMPYFVVSKVYDLKSTLVELDANAKGSIAQALKRMKITSKSDLGWAMGRIMDSFETASKFRKLIGKKPIRASKKDLNKVKKHLQSRLDRYNELNTPEIRAKKEAARLANVETQRKKQELINAENVDKFRKGESVHLHHLSFELLRVKRDEVQTSRGASVPLKDAIELYKNLTTYGNIDPSIYIGSKIGSFRLNDIKDHANGDKLIEIGCHNILLSEAKQVLSTVIVKNQSEK